MTDRSSYYETHKPYVVVEEAGGVWNWSVLDPRWRTKLGCPTVVAEGSADTRVLAYERANWAISKIG